MKVLMIGDVVGKAGINALEEKLENIIKVYNIDFVIANIENASSNGINIKDFNRIDKLNIDAYTLGNHVWSKKDAFIIVKNKNVVRPANMYKGLPGKGYRVIEKEINGQKTKIAVINLLGRAGINIMTDNPFSKAMEIVKKVENETEYIFVDFHAEATAEVKTMGYMLDGKVTAVVGTHTHVQTADEKILENKTAYITDIGMTGIHDSVIGMKKDIAIKRFLKCIPERYEPEQNGEKIISAVIIDADNAGRAISIERINI